MRTGAAESQTQPQAFASQPQWHWPVSSTLVIELQVGTSAVLLVRQLNDGGWRLRGIALETAQLQPGEFFITIPLPPGRHRLTLKRVIARLDGLPSWKW